MLLQDTMQPSKPSDGSSSVGEVNIDVFKVVARKGTEFGFGHFTDTFTDRRQRRRETAFLSPQWFLLPEGDTKKPAVGSTVRAVVVRTHKVSGGLVPARRRGVPHN